MPAYFLLRVKRSKVSGTSRSAKPARNAYTKIFAYSMVSFGPNINSIARVIRFFRTFEPLSVATWPGRGLGEIDLDAEGEAAGVLRPAVKGDEFTVGLTLGEGAEAIGCPPAGEAVVDGEAVGDTAVGAAKFSLVASGLASAVVPVEPAFAVCFEFGDISLRSGKTPAVNVLANPE